MIKIFALLTPVLLLFAGCGHTPLREIHPAAMPPYRAAEKVSAARAQAMAKILAPLKVRGALVFPSAIYDKFTFEQVFSALKQCNFNRIYCHIISEQELDDRLAGFISGAKLSGFAVEIVISQQDFYRRYQVNQVIRGAMIQYPTLIEAVQLAAEFNAGLPETGRLDGITVQLTPHLYSGKNIRRMYNSIYAWSEKSYGKGGDNDMLMLLALENLRQIAALEQMPPLTVAIHDFYHEKALSGDLSGGTIRDFAAAAPTVAVINTANLPSQLAVNIAGELQSIPTGKKVLAVIPLATHTSIDSTRLRRRNWGDLLRALEVCITSAKKYPGFAGIILSPFSVVEYLRLEK